MGLLYSTFKPDSNESTVEESKLLSNRNPPAEAEILITKFNNKCTKHEPFQGHQLKETSVDTGISDVVERTDGTTQQNTTNNQTIEQYGSSTDPINMWNCEESKSTDKAVNINFSASNKTAEAADISGFGSSVDFDQTEKEVRYNNRANNNWSSAETLISDPIGTPVDAAEYACYKKYYAKESSPRSKRMIYSYASSVDVEHQSASPYFEAGDDDTSKQVRSDFPSPTSDSIRRVPMRESSVDGEETAVNIVCLEEDGAGYTGNKMETNGRLGISSSVDADEKSCRTLCTTGYKKDAQTQIVRLKNTGRKVHGRGSFSLYEDYKYYGSSVDADLEPTYVTAPLQDDTEFVNHNPQVQETQLQPSDDVSSEHKYSEKDADEKRVEHEMDKEPTTEKENPLTSWFPVVCAHERVTTSWKVHRRSAAQMKTNGVPTEINKTGLIHNKDDMLPALETEHNIQNPKDNIQSPNNAENKDQMKSVEKDIEMKGHIMDMDVDSMNLRHHNKTNNRIANVLDNSTGRMRTEFDENTHLTKMDNDRENVTSPSKDETYTEPQHQNEQAIYDAENGHLNINTPCDRIKSSSRKKREVVALKNLPKQHVSVTNDSFDAEGYVTGNHKPMAPSITPPEEHYDRVYVSTLNGCQNEGNLHEGNATRLFMSVREDALLEERGQKPRNAFIDKRIENKAINVIPENIHHNGYLSKDKKALESRAATLPFRCKFDDIAKPSSTTSLRTNTTTKKFNNSIELVESDSDVPNETFFARDASKKIKTGAINLIAESCANGYFCDDQQLIGNIKADEPKTSEIYEGEISHSQEKARRFNERVKTSGPIIFENINGPFMSKYPVETADEALLPLRQKVAGDKRKVNDNYPDYSVYDYENKDHEEEVYANEECHDDSGECRCEKEKEKQKNDEKQQEREACKKKSAYRKSYACNKSCVKKDKKVECTDEKKNEGKFEPASSNDRKKAKEECRKNSANRKIEACREIWEDDCEDDGEDECEYGCEDDVEEDEEDSGEDEDDDCEDNDDEGENEECDDKKDDKWSFREKCRRDSAKLKRDACYSRGIMCRVEDEDDDECEDNEDDECDNDDDENCVCEEIEKEEARKKKKKEVLLSLSPKSILAYLKDISKRNGLISDDDDEDDEKEDEEIEIDDSRDPVVLFENDIDNGGPGAVDIYDDKDVENWMKLESDGILIGKAAMERFRKKYTAYGGGTLDLFKEGDDDDDDSHKNTREKELQIGSDEWDGSRYNLKTLTKTQENSETSIYSEIPEVLRTKEDMKDLYQYQASGNRQFVESNTKSITNVGNEDVSFDGEKRPYINTQKVKQVPKYEPVVYGECDDTGKVKYYGERGDPKSWESSSVDGVTILKQKSGIIVCERKDDTYTTETDCGNVEISRKCKLLVVTAEDENEPYFDSSVNRHGQKQANTAENTYACSSLQEMRAPICKDSSQYGNIKTIIAVKGEKERNTRDIISRLGSLNSGPQTDKLDEKRKESVVIECADELNENNDGALYFDNEENKDRAELCSDEEDINIFRTENDKRHVQEYNENDDSGDTSYFHNDAASSLGVAYFTNNNVDDGDGLVCGRVNNVLSNECVNIVIHQQGTSDTANGKTEDVTDEGEGDCKDVHGKNMKENTCENCQLDENDRNSNDDSEISQLIKPPIQECYDNDEQQGM